MKKRIYVNFLGLALLCVLLTSALLCPLFFYTFKAREIASVKDNAGLIAALLDRETIPPVYYAGGASAPRVTLIAPDGTVLLDTRANAGALENHAGRPEIAEAQRAGAGEATRYSDTLRAETYYYAVRLEGGNVLRLSKTIGSMSNVFTTALPIVFAVIALVLLLSNFLARRLTGNIVGPLSSIDLEGDNAVVYDELLPYVKKIDQHKREIAAQIAALQNRADTIAAITENMKEGLILLDGNGVTLTANRSAADIFGEITHKNILHICRDTEFRQCTKQCLAGDSAEMDFKRGGRIFNVYFSPVSGDAHGAVVLFFDTTERHAAEKQRREFSANVSHELKTPLTSISALSEMIANGMAKSSDVTGFAARISEQAGRLINIIEDIASRRFLQFIDRFVHRIYIHTLDRAFQPFEFRPELRCVHGLRAAFPLLVLLRQGDVYPVEYLL